MGRQAGRGRRKVQLASARNPRRAHLSRRWYLRYLQQTPHGLDRVRGRQGDVRWSPRAHRIGGSCLNTSKPTPIQSCTEEEGRGVCNGKSCLSSQPALFNYGLFPLDFMYRQQLYLNELGYYLLYRVKQQQQY